MYPEQILSTLAWIVLIWIGMSFLQNWLKARNDILAEQIKEVKTKIIEVNIEKYKDTYYLFNKKTDEFVAQGKTMIELKDRCNLMYKNKIIITDNKQLEHFGLISKSNSDVDSPSESL